MLANADVVVAASLGQAPAPGLLVRALGAGAVPIAARLPAYEEVVGDGLLFEPGDVDVLAGPARARDREPALSSGCASRARTSRWSRVADEAEAIYERAGRASAARRSASSPRCASGSPSGP